MISDGKECLITLHLTNQTKQIPKNLSIQIPRNLSLQIPRNVSIQIPWNVSIELVLELRNTCIMLCHTFSWSVPFDTILFKVFALFRNFSVCNLSKVYTLNLRQTTNKTYLSSILFYHWHLSKCKYLSGQLSSNQEARIYWRLHPNAIGF